LKQGSNARGEKYNEQGQILITPRQILLRLRRAAQVLSLGEIRKAHKYLSKKMTIKNGGY
jgi:hypothetical protein